MRVEKVDGIDLLCMPFCGGGGGEGGGGGGAGGGEGGGAGGGEGGGGGRVWRGGKFHYVLNAAECFVIY